jgi:mannosyltransferase
VSEKGKDPRVPLDSSRIWLILIILLGSAVRLYRLYYQSLWFDESLSMALASAPLKISIEATLAEGLQHLPLYYLLLRIFVWIGRSETVLRLPSAVCGVLAIPLIYQVGRRCLGQGTGLFAALLLAVNPYHVWFSQEARMYSLLMLSTLGALYFFLRLLRENRRSLWLGFIVFHAIGYCTLYFAFFIPLIEFAFILCTWRINYTILRRWTLAQFVAALTLSPWIVAIFLSGYRNFGIGWIPRPQWYAPLQTLWNFSIGYTEVITPLVAVSLVVFWLAFVWGLVSATGDQAPARLLLSLWVGLPIAITFLMSFRRPFYVDRYLIICLPAFLVLVARGALHPRPRLARWGWALALLVASSIGLSRVYFDAEYYTKEDWRGAAQYIAQHEQPGDVIALRLAASALPFNYYYQGQLERVPITNLDTIRPVKDIAAGHQRLWLVRPHYHDSTHLLAKSQPELTEADETDPLFLRWVNDHRSDVVEVKELSGLRLTLYKLSR